MGSLASRIKRGQQSTPYQRTGYSVYRRAVRLSIILLIINVSDSKYSKYLWRIRRMMSLSSIQDFHIIRLREN